jgi:hypothetical protein
MAAWSAGSSIASSGAEALRRPRTPSFSLAGETGARPDALPVSVSARAISPPSLWACSRKFLETGSSIRIGEPVSSMFMYVRNWPEASSRSPELAPCVIALDTACDARLPWIKMMAAWAATARDRILIWRSLTTWSTTSSVISSTSSPDTVSVVSA